MRFANVDGRAALVVESHATGGLALDLERSTQGSFDSDPMQAFARWPELRETVRHLPSHAAQPFRNEDLGAPSPRPAQIFGIGLNYREHATETGATIPESPLTFTKFRSSINAPFGSITIDVPTADWEVELVLVIGTGGRNIASSGAWSHVAGLCVGQDISDRLLQRATQPPQFNLGKSRAGYTPFGPWLQDAQTVANRDALTLSCSVNGVEKQRSSTDDLIFDVATLISYLSAIVELLPGDVIFTGTPSGVGGARKPPEFLKPGDVVTSTLEGVGSISNHCV
jgi:2-keto-4-pentenoate hydratase/2-oxohepta-3-ene-1,7-dioic acid hydratase in catechol pathway